MNKNVESIELQVLKNELEFSKAQQGMVSGQYKLGFLAGLRQAIMLIENAQREVSEYESEDK